MLRLAPQTQLGYGRLRPGRRRPSFWGGGVAIWGASGAPTGRQTLVHLNGAADALKWPKMDEFSKFFRPDYLEFYHEEIGVGHIEEIYNLFE